MRLGTAFPLWMLVAAWAIVGTALPALSGRFAVFAIRGACWSTTRRRTRSGHARSRPLESPRPPHPEFFEAPYLLFGTHLPRQVSAGPGPVFGCRGAGLWSSDLGRLVELGLFAATLFWMLAGWTNRMWALLGTEFAVIGLGITHPWATPYWGGMVAAAGGAILFGAARYTFLVDVLQGIAFVAGTTAAFNGERRTFWPGWGWWCSSTRGLMKGALSACRRRSCLAVGCFAVRAEVVLEKMAAWADRAFGDRGRRGGDGIYNHAVTGSWKTLPYRELHPRQ